MIDTNTNKISVQEALRQIKLTESKIAKNNIVSLIAVKQPNETVVSGSKSKEEFVVKAESTYQSTRDLMTRYHKLKEAVAVSNANTYIEVGGVRMSVASAIERKTSITMDQLLLSKLRTEYALALRTASQHEQQIAQQAEVAAQAVLSKDEISNKALAYNQFIEKFKADRKVEIVDPINVAKQIEELENFIDAFTADVDTALTISNVRTEIEIN